MMFAPYFVSNFALFPYSVHYSLAYIWCPLSKLLEIAVRTIIVCGPVYIVLHQFRVHFLSLRLL